MALVKGDPSERRRFLDELLVARQPRWAGVRADYDKVLKQRNALLKSAAPVLRRDSRRAHRSSTTLSPSLSTASVDKDGDKVVDDLCARRESRLRTGAADFKRALRCLSTLS